MNCQDIARVLDEREVATLLDTELSAIRAHLATCRDCARDWQIHAQLSNAAIPAVPAGLRAYYSARVAGDASPGARRRSRFVVIGTVVALVAAAAMLALKMNVSPRPATATADPVQVKPPAIKVASEALLSRTDPMSDDESKALEEWTRRVGEWLAIRDDPDALITAALLLRGAPGDPQRIQSLLQRATAMAPESARIQATAMLLCLALAPCDATSYEQTLRRLAPDNALGWAGELNRSSQVDDKAALRSALTAMARARTFDRYWGASILAMGSQIRAARVAPPDITGTNRPISSDVVAIGVFTALPIPAFSTITRSCKSATDERTLLECHQIGAAMRAGDTLLVNSIGVTVSGYGLPADSDEARSLAQQRNQIKWIMSAPQESALVAEDPEDFLRALANYPREIEAWRALLEEHGIPTEPPADWKP